MVAPTPTQSPARSPARSSARSRTVAIELFLPNDPTFHALPDVRSDGSSDSSESHDGSSAPRLSPLPPLVDSSSDDDGLDVDVSLEALMEACWLFCKRATALYCRSRSRGLVDTLENLGDEVRTLFNKFAVLRGELRPLWSDDYLWKNLVGPRRLYADYMDKLQQFNSSSAGLLWREIDELEHIAEHLHDVVDVLWTIRKMHVDGLPTAASNAGPIR